MDNGGGWGIRFINGFYDLTHPLASSVAEWRRATRDADGVASRRVQFATGADDNVRDSSGRRARAGHCGFDFCKVTATIMMGGQVAADVFVC